MLRRRELIELGWAMTGDLQIGEDLAQAALAKLWRRWSRVNGSAEPSAYARRIVVNEWLSWRRRKWRRVEIPAVHLTGQSESVDEADAADTREVVRRWLAMLPPGQRTVVTLRFMLDLPIAETAAIIGVTQGTVKSQAAKALESLRFMAGADPAGERARGSHG